ELHDVGSPLHGTVVFDTKLGPLRYTSAQGFAGTDTFTYTITNPGGGTATATVTVTVLSVTLTCPAPMDVFEGTEAVFDVTAVTPYDAARIDVLNAPLLTGMVFDPLSSEPGALRMYRFHWTPQLGAKSAVL